MGPAYAHAGAWPVPGDGQSIENVAVGQRNDVDVYEVSGYGESGVDGRRSWVSTGWGEFAEDNADGTRAESYLGVKYALVTNEHAAISVQAGVLYITDPRDGCSEGGVELRFMGGRNFRHGSFANLEVAGRALDGGEECLGSRVELTVGRQDGGRWLALGQILVDAPLDGEDTVKAQFSLVRFGNDGGRGIQFGLRVRLDGGAAEPALVLGLWRRRHSHGD